MKLLENTKISVKIIALLVMLGAVTLLVAWNGARTLAKADAEYSDIVNDTMNGTVLSRAGRDAINMRFAAFQAMAYKAGTPEAEAGVAAENQSFEDARKGFATAKQQQPELKPQIEKFETTLQVLHQLTEPAAQYGARDQNDQAMGLLAKADKLGAAFTADIKALNDSTFASSNKRNDEQSAIDNNTGTSMLVMSIVGTLAGIGIAFFVSRSGITGPIFQLSNRMTEIAAGNFGGEIGSASRGDELGAMGRAVQVFRDNGIAKQAAEEAIARAGVEQKMVVETVSNHLSELSAGDLTTTITTTFPSDYAALKSNFNEALEKLRELIGSVRDSAATIRTGSTEIAQASEDLARRTESNAASLEETAASVTQMDGRLKASAQAASRTVERADQAIATVGSGRAVADEAVQAMTRVSDSAKGIDSVIEGLDKIAFQTRVLAMNAAVEAGRAGDAGRGFAVVADLVSALAMRAEEEAKRARDQLTVTQTDIVTAVEAVTKVDDALANISGDVGQVHELLATMAADNQAQSAAITQISAAIGTMDQATQQNAAMVEETSAAARNLSSEVGSLSEQANRFNVGGVAEAPLRAASASTKRRQVDAKSYASPVKALPAAGIAALVRSEEEWKDF